MHQLKPAVVRVLGGSPKATAGKGIYEAQDFTVGLFDSTGKTISVGLGLPMFIGGLSNAIKAKIDHYGPDGIQPGDILLTNDGYIMGSHLNQMTFTLPIFFEGELVGFASSMAPLGRRRRRVGRRHTGHLQRRPAGSYRQNRQGQRA